MATLRVEAARKPLSVVDLMYKTGRLTIIEYLAAHRAFAFAARDSGLPAESVRSSLEEYARTLAKAATAAHEAEAMGKINLADVAMIDAAVAEADYWLAEQEERR